MNWLFQTKGMLLRALLLYMLVGAFFVRCSYNDDHENTDTQTSEDTSKQDSDNGTPTVLKRAHAHNDYAHTRPLLDALDNGFASIEADIFLVDDQLLVGHFENLLQKDRTLQSLYLHPLRTFAERNGGWVHADKTQVTLLIDIKSDAESTYTKLSSVLEEYGDIVTVFGEEGRIDKALLVIITGNRPRETMEKESTRYAAYDGRLQDLEQGYPAHFMPLVSDRWPSHFTWNGADAMPDDQRQKLGQIVETAHQEGKRVRFWSTPEQPTLQRDAVWQELLGANIDLINTDDLAGLREFLLLNDPLLTE